MSQTSTTSPSSDSSTAGLSGWERLFEDMRNRPQYYTVLAIVAAVVVTAALLGFRYFRDSGIESQNERISVLSEALGAGEPSEVLVRMQEIESTLADTPSEQRYWYQRILIGKVAGDQASKQDDKLRYYRGALEDVNTLKSKFPNSLWIKMPARPAITPQAPKAPSLVDSIVAYCEGQIAWLEKHPYEISDEPDAGLTVTFTLEEPAAEGGEPTKHTMRIQCFSKAAPRAVDAFVQLARKGYFEGTSISGIQRAFQQEDAMFAVFGSAMSKVAPDDTSLWNNNDDHIGVSLANEPNHLERTAGRIAMDRFGDAAGVDPSNFVLYVADAPAYESRNVFAQVHEEDREILDRIKALEVDAGTAGPNAFGQNLIPLKPWKVIEVKVEGQPAHPPADPMTLEITLPEKPSEDDEDK